MVLYKLYFMDKTEIAKKILLLFKDQNLKTYDIITEKWLKFTIIDKLEPAEKLLINDALLELIEQEFIITKNEYGLHLILTEKGFNSIYIIDREKTIVFIYRKILENFKQNILNLNYRITETWLRFELVGNLNPKEKELVNLAIDKLVRDGIVAIDNKRGLELILTENGSDLLNE